MALEQEAVIATLLAPKSYTRPHYVRIDKQANGATIGHQMATYASEKDAKTASKPRIVHSMDLTESEQKEITDTVFSLLYKFQKTREDFANATDV